MASFFTDNDDLQWWFEKGIDWAKLVEVSEYGWRAPDGFKTPAEGIAFYRDVTSMVGELIADDVAPRAAQIDRDGAHLSGGEAVESPAVKAVMERFKEIELHKLCLPRELGGMNAPLLVYFLNAEMIARADVSLMTHFSFHGGMAMAMLAYSVHEGTTEFDAAAGKISATRFAKEIEEISRGDAWGCMDITEPNAGSDMAALRARGEQDADGNWFVTGQKIFITSGHGKYHFVIARTEEPKPGEDAMSGLKGLSMFLVPTYEDLPDGTRRRWVTLDRVEEKLGHHGSVTAALSFDRAPARLIGKRGEGFKYMLVLMNNARLGVGFESIGLAECAVRQAREYAAGRASMGKTIDRHEMIADMLDEMDMDVRLLRALAVTGAYHEELAQKLGLVEKFGLPPDEARRARKEVEVHRAKARRLTPLLKYLAAEKAVEIARRNVQIHGGVGYTQDYGAEKLLRDALVLPIYEGTSQIQSLMAMKDTLIGIIKNPKEFVRRTADAKARAIYARDDLEKRVAKLSSQSLAAQQFLLTRTAAAKLRELGGTPVSAWKGKLSRMDPKRDFALAMLHAERLTKLLAWEAIAEILLEQSRKFPERRALLEKFLDRIEIPAKYVLEELTTTGGRILGELAGAPAAADGAGSAA